MGNRRSSKRPRPSYEDGEFRDPKIAEKQDPEYRRDDLLRTLRKAASPVTLQHSEASQGVNNSSG